MPFHWTPGFFPGAEESDMDPIDVRTHYEEDQGSFDAVGWGQLTSIWRSDSDGCVQGGRAVADAARLGMDEVVFVVDAEDPDLCRVYGRRTS